MDNSLIQTLKTLAENPYPIKGVVLGNQIGIQVNTVEKNICYIRKEFGDHVILTSMDDTEKCCLYKLNKNHVPESNHYEKIGEETRSILEEILILTIERPYAVGTHSKPSEATPDTLPIAESEKGSLNAPTEVFKSKLDRINQGISPENVRNLIERCQKVLLSYPDGHPQRPRIETQIERLKA